MSNFMKMRPVGGQSIYADVQTDGRREANSRSSQFCKCA